MCRSVLICPWCSTCLCLMSAIDRIKQTPMTPLMGYYIELMDILFKKDLSATAVPARLEGLAATVPKFSTRTATA